MKSVIWLLSQSSGQSARRWRIFFSHKRAVISAIFLFSLAFMSLTAEVWSNNRPLVLYYQQELYFPVFEHYPPKVFNQSQLMRTDYKALHLQESDWVLWPINRWDPYQSNKTALEYPAPPSYENWLGTDDRGRDIFARLLYGFRYSLLFSIGVWFLSSILAVVYGGMCGYLGGWIDLIGQRVAEIISTLPSLLLLIFFVAVFDASLTLLIIVSCALGWIGLSYYVRGEVLRNRKMDYVEAARALGATNTHIFFGHVLPNSLIPVLTFAPFLIVANISGLAALDFMGLGLPSPTPSWGELLQQAQNYFSWAWWLAFFPGFILFLTLLSLTLVGDGIRHAFDPSAALPIGTRKYSPVIWIENIKKWRLGWTNKNRVPQRAV